MGRRNARRQAEADEFPWTRKLNFPEEKTKISWDDGVYDPKTLEEMNAIRARNVPIIDDLDAKVQEQQRMWRMYSSHHHVIKLMTCRSCSPEEKGQRGCPGC